MQTGAAAHAALLAQVHQQQRWLMPHKTLNKGGTARQEKRRPGWACSRPATCNLVAVLRPNILATLNARLHEATMLMHRLTNRLQTKSNSKPNCPTHHPPA